MTGIVTLTASAAIDQTYLLTDLVVGGVNRAVGANQEISGKGVNVARAVQLSGQPVSAVLAIGELDAALVERSGFADTLRAIIVPGHTRRNTTITDKNGRTTKVNELAIPLSGEHWNALRETALAEVDRLDADWLVLCGSLPSLVETGKLVPVLELIDSAAATGTRIAIDTSGAALDLIANHLEHVALLKPNTHELAELVGRDLLTVGHVIDAAQELRRRGVEVVFASMGEDGSLGVAEEGVWWARVAAPKVVNSAGAGDAALAGFLVNAINPASDDQRTLDVPRALAAAASWGALAVSQATTLLCDIESAPIADLIVSPDSEYMLLDPARVTREKLERQVR